MPGDTTLPGAGRTVAVIVVSGVGDDALGGGRDAIVATLTEDPERRWVPGATCSTVRMVATADSGDDARDGGPLVTGKGSPNLRRPFAVPTARIESRGDAPPIDVYEMHWADLSRAQGPVQRLFYLLFAITMQVSTIGLEAVRQFAGELDPTGGRVRKWLAWTLNAMSYWLVYLITPLVLAMVALAITVNIELLTGATGQTSWALLAVLGLGAGAAGWWIGGRVYRGGWTFDPPNDPWAYRERATSRPSPWPFRVLLALTVAFVGAVIWLGSGAARDLAVQVIYLVGVCGAAVVLGLLVADVSTEPDSERLHTARMRARRRVRCVIQAAYAAIPVGAMLLAVLNEPRDGGAGVRAANALTMIAGGAFRGAWLVMLVWCSVCVVLALWMRMGRRPHRGARQRLSATVMLSVMLGPLLYSLATSAMFLVFAAAWRVYPESAKRWPANEPGCAGDTIARPIVECIPGPVRSTADWGTEVVRAVVQPLGLAMLLATIFVALIGWFARPYIATFRPRNTHANAVDVALRQGRALTRTLVRTGRDGMYIAYVVMVVVITLGAAAIWLDGRDAVQNVGDFLASVAFPMAYALAVLAVAGVGLRNVGFLGRFGGGFLRLLGLVLDTIYDVTTYLRMANPAIVAPRIQMIARSRAVLKHARERGYGHVVVMAHSQGTILTLATLLGDDDRAPRVTRPATDDLPPAITFLSYGSPVTQTYAQRFPGQFSDWPGRAVAPTSPISWWLNVYRAGDYVGRWIRNAAASGPDAPDTPPIRERCLGPGHHTGYPADERWRRVARHVVATPAGKTRISDVALADLTVAVIDQPPA